MDGSENGDSATFRVGDVEKEREIERRLRELGLWENKRRLESHVASMLDAQIDEKDALSKTLRNCRRKRTDGKTAIDEIRNIISPRVVRDCYGQRLAYHVNILMGCFTKDVRYDFVDGVVVICGSTAPQDDPTRLTKEIRLELPPSLNMAALTVSYAAGAVKVRVPYLLEDFPKSRTSSNDSGLSDGSNSNNNNNSRQYRFSSVSPLYSLNLQLNNRRRQGPGSSEGVDSPMTTRSDSPNLNGTSTGTASHSSPGSVNSESRSLSDELQLSPYPVFEEEQEERTLHRDFESRIDIADKSNHESFNMKSKLKSTHDQLINSDRRVDQADSGNALSLELLPSSENHDFDKPGSTNGVVISGGTDVELRRNELSSKYSECRLDEDSIENSSNNVAASNSNVEQSDFNQATSNNLIDCEVKTSRPSSSETTLNSEIADDTDENRDKYRSMDILTTTDLASKELPRNREVTDFLSTAVSSRDSGIFSVGGTRSFIGESYSDQDASMTEWNHLDSERSPSANRSTGYATEGSVFEKELSPKDSVRVSNANERTFSSSGIISPSGSSASTPTLNGCHSTGTFNDVTKDSIEDENPLRNSTNPPSTVKPSASRLKSFSNDINVIQPQKRPHVDNFKSPNDASLLNLLLDNGSDQRATEADTGSATERRLLMTSPSSGESVDEKKLSSRFEISTHPLKSDTKVVDKYSSVLNDLKFGSVNRKSLPRESSIRVDETSSENPRTNGISAGSIGHQPIRPSKLNEEAERNDDSTCLEESSIFDDQDLVEHRRHRPYKERSRVCGSAGAEDQLNDVQPNVGKVTVDQTGGPIRSVGNRPKTKRTRANLSFILDSLDETFL